MSRFRQRVKHRYGRLLLAAVVTIVLLEFLSFLLFESLTGAPFDLDATRRARRARLEDIRSRMADSRPARLYDVHPYLGYTGRAGAHPWKERDVPFNEYGMACSYGHAYPYRKAPGEYVIGILGGSVAEIFANNAQPAIQQWLRRLAPEFGDKSVVLISLATGGYKQPQQLFHLQYALLAGFEFDAVVNIDGFNDLVLASENSEVGIHPLYPSGYHWALLGKQLDASYDLNNLGLLSRIYRQTVREKRFLTFADTPPFRYSVFCNLLSLRMSRRCQRRVQELKYGLTMDAQHGIPDEYRGPTFTGHASIHRAAAVWWQHASRMIQATCDQHGIVYVHALHPNQYVRGSKTLTARELKKAYKPNSTWARHAPDGYRYLRDHGGQLRAAGVAFYDMTMIFQGVDEDIYVDSCCHFGDAGNDLLAREIAKALVAESRE